jgi:hypothetical protein
MNDPKRNPAANNCGARNADLVEAAIGSHLGPRRRIFQERIDFAAINRAAISALPAILARPVPGGKRIGGEYVVLNPTRADRRLGSFEVNMRAGAWSDFATGDGRRSGLACRLPRRLLATRRSAVAWPTSCRAARAIWPDADEMGAKYAAKWRPYFTGSGARFRSSRPWASPGHAGAIYFPRDSVFDRPPPK